MSSGNIIENMIDHDHEACVKSVVPTDSGTGKDSFIDLSETKSSMNADMDTGRGTAYTVTTYENYLALAEKALRKSRKSLDTRALIKLAYGDDTAHIGGSDMLMGILDGVLDKIAKETVLQEFKHYGTSITGSSACNTADSMADGECGETKNDDKNTTVIGTSPMERLDKIDVTIVSVIEWEQRRDQIEGMDAQSARESLNKNLLPEGVTMEDVVAYQEHAQRIQARTALQLELQIIQDETFDLQTQSEENQTKMRNQLGRVEAVELVLEASANACAMVVT
mmetsp:Transcript_112755/g.230751  ORF Transcript_112755/g.230751 Transcript_112755/m.230751 type:complete len:281 (-) Transcript_112755:281-1123(-)|eukprot:CAMPEP_0201201914 /NCGR_PEP_ID=MMETSP0851-20130426/163906_1 /ASSEMBLY_ACC=CAM_ASM_000631 /TAXON_ID=183588 /ORGANISM="Pseudo-nitzschia fraudulenta, Strain WWA7" /LENGTH=280 /DNA_ID=CAMNT_0047489679 /DNA_START=41 /DNA_END=883 /DNA_ORIENTATION=+